jgi:hypothetical protein
MFGSPGHPFYQISFNVSRRMMQGTGVSDFAIGQHVTREIKVL